MSRYDSRSGDPCSYRDRRSDSGFGGGYESSNRSSSSSYKNSSETSSSSPKILVDLDGLTHFEKNFYIESPSIAAMNDDEVDAYRLKRQSTVEGKDVPKPV
ncbi:RNA helicase [Ranunculus cassubicifolius]